MNRWLLVFALVISGCVATLPDDDGVTADLSCETARQVVLSRREIAPSPAPAGDACERCGGRGYIGDQASIRIKCEACKGTGKACATGVCR